MVISFVNEHPQQNSQGRIAQAQHVQAEGRERIIQYYASEIINVTIHGVNKEQRLNTCRQHIYRIKNSRGIYQQAQEYIVQMHNVPEKNIQSREHHPDPNIKNNQTPYRK